MSEFELPEIETLKRDLERDAVGRKIKVVEIEALKSMPHHRTKKSFTSLVEGAKIEMVERNELSIVMTLNNEHTIVITLGNGASMVRCPSKTKTESGTAVVITFTQGGDLRIIDPDNTSEVTAIATEELDTLLTPEDERGLDLLVQPLSWIDFGRFILGHKDPLKAVLMNDKLFVGIGLIYSDEILFDAGLRYDRKANALTTQEIRRLYRSVVGILFDAVKYRGTSLEKRPFVDLNGDPGDYGDHISVYGKNGELSPRSRLPIEKAQFKGKPVYFCSTQV